MTDLDPAFVFNPDAAQQFWDNQAFFQAESQRKHQAAVERILGDAKMWLDAEAENSS